MITNYPQDSVFQVNYLADHTHSGIIHRIVVFQTPMELYKIIPVKEISLPHDGGGCKHIEFTFKRKKFDLVFHG